MTELTGTYDPTLVAVSVAVAIVSSFVALATVPRIHCSMNTKWDTVWSFVFGLSMGTGIWSMHFIGMLGFELPVPIHYDLGLTSLSLLLAIAVCGLAVFPLREGGNIGLKKIWLLGGFVGCGVAGMHYTGMAAMRMDASMQNSISVVVLSLGIAIVAASATLFIVNHLRASTIFAQVKLKLAAALIMGLAVSLMHYTAMHGVRFVAHPSAGSLAGHIDTQLLSVALVVITLLIQGGTLLVALLDEAYFHAKRSEQLANQRSEMDQALFAVLAVALEHRSLDEIMQRVLKTLLGISWLSLEKKGSVFIADAQSKTLRIAAQHELGPELTSMCDNISFGTCLCGLAASSRQIVHRSCIDADHTILPHGITPHGHYCVPILDGDSVLGVLNLYLKHGHSPSALEIQLLESVSNAMAGIIRRRVIEDRLEVLSYQDELTGLANRRKFYETFEHALSVGRRTKASLALMILDLDRFKPVNDTYGHDVGDLLLRQVALRVKGCLRDMDTFARVGGDEFMILLEWLCPPFLIQEIGARILAELDKPFEINGHSIRIGCSIGASLFPDDGDSTDTLIKQADISLYRAKESRGSIHLAGGEPAAA